MKIIILLISCLMLSGCYDYVELNNIKIVSTMFVEKDNDKFKVSFEILDTGKEKNQGSFIITGYGDTMMEAIDDTGHDSSFKPHFSHMNAVVLDSDLSKDGIDFLYDSLVRNIEIRKDFYVYVTDDMEGLLKYKTNPDESIGNYLKKMTDYNIKKYGKYFTYKFRDIIYDYLRDVDFILGEVKTDGENISLGKSYSIKNNHLVNEVSDEVVIVKNIMMGQNKSFHLDGDDTFEIHQYDFKIDIKKDAIQFKFNGNARILGSDKNNAYSKDDIEKLEKDIKNKLTKIFEDAVIYSISEVDVLGLENYYYLYYPKEKVNIEDLEYKLVLDININEKGMLIDSIGDKNGK